MAKRKGNMKLSGDVHLPEDEDDLQVATITSDVNGPTDGEGVPGSTARVRQAGVETAGSEGQPAPRRTAPRHVAPQRVKAAAARAGNSPYAFWAVSLLAVLAAVRMVR